MRGVVMVKGLLEGLGVRPGGTLGVGMIACIAFALGGCSDPSTIDVPEFPDAGTDAEADGPDGGSFPDTGIGDDSLSILRVVPDHGPFTGGNDAVIRGSGFAEGAVVHVGGRMVQPADTQLIDGHRLGIVLPAGEPGPADVSVEVDGEEALLEDGYRYEAIAIDPNRGSTSGGTRITIEGSGTAFAEGDQVKVGRGMCEDVEVVSPTRITCRTPPGSVGTVDVVVVKEEASDIVAEKAYTYYDSTDPFEGGLGGGPIEGSINVTVLNGATGTPVPDAFAMVGDDLDTEHQGLTDTMGQITFSGEDLFGRHTIHVAKHCFEKTSVVSFDARDVTVFLVPWMDPMCGDPGPPPTGSPRHGAFIEGNLIWPGDPGAHGVRPWFNVPDPRGEEQKVAYVYTTQPCPGDAPSCRNPDPASGDARQRLTEADAGDSGYPFRIFARPTGLAVYALAGLEDPATGQFTPYVMGVARSVLAGPGETVTDVEVIMDLTLDHVVDVRIKDLPGPARTGPDRFKVRTDINLGGEGYIVRRINGQLMDVARRRTAERPFRLFNQPPLTTDISDARYRVEAGWYTGEFDSQPSTIAVARGVREVHEEIVLDGFLGIPQPTAPAFGEPLPADRMLHWESDGGREPSMHMVMMIGGDGNPAWRHFVPGDVTEAPIPDLSTIPEIDDISSGFITWAIFAIHIEDFDFDEFSYRHLNSRFWSAWSQDVYTARK